MPADFQLLDASRDAAHLRDALRSGPLARFVRDVGAATDADGLERRLRTAWHELCAEVARWHDAAWHAAFAIFAAHRDLPALERVRAAGLPPAWVRSDPWLGAIARAHGDERAATVRSVYGLAVSQAFVAAAPLRQSWQRAWQASWPAVDPRLASQLAVVEAVCMAARTRDSRVLAERAAALERVFRRGAGTPATAFAYFGLIALALDHVRGSQAALLVAAELTP